MSSLCLSRLSGTLSAQRVITHPSGALRFASAASSKSARSPSPLAYKGRIPRPKPAESAEDVAAVQAASEKLAQLPPIKEKREETKEEKYKSTSTKKMLVSVLGCLELVLIASSVPRR
ncbi:hypothetical protein BDV97DRAFT_369464 [Delphinella strobiligena]|nr:hypothetical protein BDV97DRAFT_369464 [Delphinella strobiligena]